MRRGFLIFVLALTSIAFASSMSVMSAIQSEYSKGLITIDEAMLYKAYAVVDKQMLPERFRDLPSDPSGSGALIEIFQQHQNLQPETQLMLAHVLARPSGLPLEYETAHFKFHYTLTGANAVANDAYVTSMATKFENSYTFIITTRGYLTPPSDGSAGGNSKYDVYITTLSGGVLGYTSPEVDGSYSWSDATSYIVMKNNYWDASLVDMTAVHEYFHAVQLAYSYNQPVWCMEISSVWIEDEMYPSDNGEHDYDSEFFPYPWLSLTTATDHPTRPLHPYASYIFAQFFTTKFGDSTWRQVWEDCRSYNVLSALQNVASRYGSSRSTAFGEFCIWNYFTGTRTVPGIYPEASQLPLINIERTHSSYPASGTSTHAPEPLGSNYIIFNVPAGASGPLTVTFDGADGTNWVANLVIPTGSPFTARRISLNSYGYGNLTLDEADYSGRSQLILVVSNVSTSGSAANYTYNAAFESIEPSHEPARNLVAESGHAGSVPLIWDAPIGGGAGGLSEIYYDDGTPAATYFPWDLTEYGAGYITWEGTKFTVAEDCTLKELKVYFFGTPGLVEFSVNTDDAGNPGAHLTGSPFNSSVTAGSWQTITLPGSGVFVPAGDFWVGYTRTSDDFYCRIDADTTDGGARSKLLTTEDYVIPMNDLLLRARVKMPSSGLHVTGYNVYRSTTSGGPYSLRGTSATENYNDASVVDGTAYFYVVEAAYSDLVSSGYSNEAMAVPGIIAGSDFDTLKHDDGTPEYISAGFGEYDQAGVVFEPTGPCQLMSLRYFVSIGSSSTGIFGVGLYRYTGTRIANPLIEPFYWVYDPGADGWTEIDMSETGLFFSSEFAASIIFADTSVHIGLDDIDDDYSYFYDEGTSTWYGSDYKFFVQAVVRYLDSGETYTISGRVNLSAGSDGSPAPSDRSGSIIRVIETGDADTTTSTGNYTLALPSGVYTIEAWHPGYVPQTAVIGLTENTVQDFALIKYNTPLNPVRDLEAWDFDDNEVLLTWEPPFGHPGTSEILAYYYNGPDDTLFYQDSLGRGDIFDAQFVVWFPCTLKTTGIVFYKATAGAYAQVSVHLWLDDGTGYPDLDNRLCDSVVVRPLGVSDEGYPQWTEVDFSDENVILWPGQVVHVGTRLLSNNPSVVYDGRDPDYDPAQSRYYNNRASAWFDNGEYLEYLEVKYFDAGTARLSPADAKTIAASRVPKKISESAGIVRSTPVADAKPLIAHAPILPRTYLSPTETEIASEYLVYHSLNFRGPYSLIGVQADPDSFAYLHTPATNGVMHYYYVVAEYPHGFSLTSDTVDALPLTWNDSAWVLLVDDDGSSFVTFTNGTHPPDEGVALAQVMLALGIPFNVLQLPSGYFVPTSSLDDYQAIIWNCGVGYTDGWTLADSEQTNIGRYLDHGGKFALFGQDFLEDLYGSALTSVPEGTFAYEYFGLRNIFQNAWEIRADTSGSVQGHSFAEGMEWGITNPYGNWLVYPDYLVTFEGDTMLYMSCGGANGTIGATYEDSHFKTAFLASTPFMLDEISGHTVREFVRRLLEDYFEVTDPALIESTTVRYTVSAGWNLLSLPLTLPDNTLDAAFPGNIAVFAWDAVADSFFVPAEIVPGRGYFVLFTTGTTFDVTGINVEEVSQGLGNYWNIIGVPFASSGSFTLSSAAYAPAYLVSGSYFEFDAALQTYDIPTSFEVGKGYWAFVRDACIFELPSARLYLRSEGELGDYGVSSPPMPPSVKIPKVYTAGNVFPNPFNSSCTFELYVPAGENILFEVVDISGKTIYNGSTLAKSGATQIHWNGIDNNGINVASGIYFMRAKCADKVFTRRAVLLK